MRNLRPALLAMLLAAAGVGVPGSVAQGTSSKAAGKKKPPASSDPSKNLSGKSSSTKSAPAHKTSATPLSSAKGSHPTSHSAASRATGKKSVSSKRSRRQTGQKAPSTDRISEIQSALTKDGSFTGTPNGKWDDTTTDAMRRFQAAHGLNPTGKLDAPTLQKLGLGSQTAGLAAPTPPPGAVSRLTSFSSASPDSTHQ